MTQAPKQPGQDKFIMLAGNAIKGMRKMADVLANEDCTAKDFIFAATEWRENALAAIAEWPNATPNKDGFNEATLVVYYFGYGELYENRRQLRTVIRQGQTLLRIAARVFGVENVPITELRI